jgi:hypothetical protein
MFDLRKAGKHPARETPATGDSRIHCNQKSRIEGKKISSQPMCKSVRGSRSHCLAKITRWPGNRNPAERRKNKHTQKPYHGCQKRHFRDNTVMSPDKPILESLLTCPQCGHVSRETMPTDACQWYYECPACHVLLKPKPGDCCVFCSYGSVPCPPIQLHGRDACGCKT